MKRNQPIDNSPMSKRFYHFTNRESELDIINQLINKGKDEPSPVCVFYGVGGIGKTWFINQAINKICIPRKIPVAKIDFNPEKGGGDLTDSANAFAEIRRQLNVRCPKFELAYATWLYKQGKRGRIEVDASLNEFANGLLGFLADLAANNIVPFSTSFDWLLKRIAITIDSKKNDIASFKDIPPQELYSQMHVFLKEDLKANLPKRANHICQAIVFFDTFESFSRNSLSDFQQHERESWVRQICIEIPELQFIITGREHLSWGDRESKWASNDQLRQYKLSGFSKTDTRSYLGGHGINDKALQKSIMDVCEEHSPSLQTEKFSYHPQTLGICVDIIDQNKLKRTETFPLTFKIPPGEIDSLALSFLRSLEDNAREIWILRLAHTPCFDESAARNAYSQIKDVNQDAAIIFMFNLSFVNETNIKGFWTIHKTVQEALRKSTLSQKFKTDFHQFWFEYWNSRSQSEYDNYSAFTWYHQLNIDPEVACLRWNTLAKNARSSGSMIEHYSLLEWWSLVDVLNDVSYIQVKALNALGLELYFSTVGSRPKNLTRSIEYLQRALYLCSKEEAPIDWANTQTYLGHALRELPTGDRVKNFYSAINHYNEALSVLDKETHSVEWAYIQSSLGNIYRDFPDGDSLDNIISSVLYLRNALNIFVDLNKVSENNEIKNDLAMVQANLGSAYFDLGRNASELAIESYKSALDFYQMDKHPLNWAMTKMGLGNSYNVLPAGDRAKNTNLAIETYEESLHALNKDHFPIQRASVLMNLSVAYRNLPIGDRNYNLERSIKNLEEVLLIFTEDEYPEYWAMNYENLGETFREQGNIEKSLESFNLALHGYKSINKKPEAHKIEAEIVNMMKKSPKNDQPNLL